MKDLLASAIGLDIHRDMVVACLLKGEFEQVSTNETRTFGTMAHELQELREWVTASGCNYVAMESTSIYWLPIYEVLESCFDGNIHLLVVNARHMKNVPGRKTDIRDAEWIATLLRAGLLKKSFIPEKTFRELRQLTRYRKNIVHDITTQKNRIDKFLQGAGFRLSAFISDIFGASGRNIMRHLCEYGSVDMAALDKCLRTKTRLKMKDILVSANGTLSAHQCACLRVMLDHLEQIECHKKTVEGMIELEVEAHQQALSLLCSIPGIDVAVGCAIIAEIGTDMSQFPSAEHLCSWAGLCPGNNTSAGKNKSAHITKGNVFLKSMLCEAAWVIAGKRNTYLANWYWRIKQKKGAKRAVIALARKILALIYSMLKTGLPYNEDCYEQRRQLCERKRANRMIHELERMGYQVVPTT